VITNRFFFVTGNLPLIGTTALINAGRYGTSFVIKKISDNKTIYFDDQSPITSRINIKSIDVEKKKFY